MTHQHGARTAVVATVGPACHERDVLRRLIEAGAGILRLNLSHGDLDGHLRTLALIREVEGELVHDDMGVGLPFRQGTFDGVISISAIQWLCYSNDDSNPRLRLHRFFQSLYRCLRRGGRGAPGGPRARGLRTRHPAGGL